METKNSDKSLNKKDCKVSSTTKVNMIWLITILFIIIVLLLAYILSNNICCAELLRTGISDASLLLSIILSIFAIQYTYFSNVQIQSQFEKIDTAANNINETSVNLQNTNHDLKNSIDDILTQLGKMDSSMEQLKNISNKNNKQSIDINNVPNSPQNTTE